MDAIELDDIARSRATPPAVKLAQALEAMEMGMRLRRSKLKHDHPDASDEEIVRMFGVWLRQDD